MSNIVEHYHFPVEGTVYFSGSVQSSSGESVHYSGSKDYSDAVDVRLTIETAPFENSVHDAVREIKALTAANLAATAAMCESRKEAARLVSRTIIGGFGQLILSEVSQLKTEAAAKLPSLLQELVERAKACQGKQDQLAKDYQRITERYAEIFRTLDENLEAAQRNLDKPLYKFVTEVHDFLTNNFTSPYAGATLIGSAEVNNAEIALSMAKLRQTAVKMMQLTQRNLRYTNELDQGIESMLFSKDDPAAIQDEHPVFVPVVTCDHSGAKDKETVRSIATPDFIQEQTSVQAEIEAAKQNFNVPPVSGSQLSQLDMFFRKKLSQSGSNADPDQVSRINAEILRMWKNSTQKIIS